MAGPIRADEAFRPSYRPAPKPRGGMDPEMRRMALVALAAGGGVALIVGAVSLMPARHKGVPVIEAEAGPVRIKPIDPGGMKVSGAELTAGVNGANQQLMPAPEQPELRALKAQVREMHKELARQAAASAQAMKLAQAAAAAKAAPVVAAATVAKASATKVIERPMTPVSVKMTLPPVDAVPAGTQVQLGAFKDEGSARAKWAQLVHDMPEILGGRVPDIAAASAAGQMMWRLRTGDFTDVAQAAGFCQRLRAKSVACNVAAF